VADNFAEACAMHEANGSKKDFLQDFMDALGE